MLSAWPPSSVAWRCRRCRWSSSTARSARRRSVAAAGRWRWFVIGTGDGAGSIAASATTCRWCSVSVLLGIGLAYPIYYAVEGRHLEARQQEQDAAPTCAANGRYSQGPATL